MKKILFLLVAVFAMSSCVVEGDGIKLRTITVKVKASEWSYTQQGAADQFNNNYFYAGIDVPEITSRVFDYGEVKAYVVFDRQSTYYARKHLLPYVLHKEDKNAYGDWFYFTETYDFTYGIGWVEFNFRTSDFAYEDDVNINPPTMEFDIVITYPQE